MLVWDWWIKNKNNQSQKIICEGKPGIVLDEKLTIGCSKNAVQILEVKKEGKQKWLQKNF